MQYGGTLSSGTANVDLATFSNPAGGGAYVVWCPTSNGTTVPAYALQLSGSATQATQIVLADQQPTGVQSPLTIAGGQVSVDVSETPTLVLVDAL
jgi:hypothetical protein